MFDFKEKTRKVICGGIITADNGLNMYTPDGTGFYHALWTRDFAYMVEYAGDLMDKTNIKGCIEYLLGGAAANGWIPDRIGASGKVCYHAGGDDFPGLDNLDNGSFLVIAADAYLKMISKDEAKELFAKWREGLIKGIDCLPTDEYGMIVNETDIPHSPYGFTDCIKKTGKLAMETLLLWRALNSIVKWSKDIGEDDEAYEKHIRLIEDNFLRIFEQESGMLYAATKICKQIDLWASCYAVSIGFPMSQRNREKISDWFITHYDEVVFEGQLRHLPKGEYWEDTITPVAHETYQNGAFWATPTGWLYDTLSVCDKKSAEKAVNECLESFEKKGIFECINRGYEKLSPYAVSAANVYYAYKLMH